MSQLHSRLILTIAGLACLGGKCGKSKTPSTTLDILKTGSPNTVIEGDTIKYTVLVKNIGTATAQNVVVSDTMGSTAVALGGGDCLPSEPSCSAAALPPGKTLAYGATVTAGPCNPGPYTITDVAGAKADNADTVSAHAETAVTCKPKTKAATVTLLNCFPNPGTFGQPVTCDATVTSSGGTPTGTVAYFVGTLPLGSAALNAAGVAALTTSSLATGTDSISATYGGDANFASSTSDAFTEMINPPAPRVGKVGTMTNGANDDSDPDDPENDGDFAAAFSSVATNLVSPPTTKQNVFISICPGTPTATCYDPAATTGRAKILLVSATDAGAEGNGASGGSMWISKDGRYVLFRSFATNLPGKASDVYVRDTCQDRSGAMASCTPATYLGSATDTGGSGNNGTLDGALSGDGVMACFASASTNVVTGVTTAGEIYCHNTCAGPNTPLSGCTAATFLVTNNTSGKPSNYGGDSVAVNLDGRFVCYRGVATDLVAGVTTSGEVYCTDTCHTSGGAVASCTQTTILVSQGNDGKPCSSKCVTFARPKPAMSDDGRFVVFNVDPIALLPNDTNNKADVYLRDTCRTASGAVANCTATTTLVSVGTDGNAANDSSQASEHAISGNGRFVAFDSQATNLIAGGNAAGQIFVRDTCGGSSGPVASCTPTTVMVSVDGTTPLGGFGSTISGDGRFAVFATFEGTGACPGATCHLHLVLAATGF